MSDLDRLWFPVQTQPRREAFAAGQLEKQGFTTFFPRRLVTVRHARRLESRQASYFPGYLFVALDLSRDRWRSVNGTFGVRSLVMFGGRPAAAPLGFVEGLRAVVGADGLLATPADFAPGDRVKLLAGPFAEVVGVIDRLDGAERVRILLDLVYGALPVVAKTRDIALAS